MKTQLTLADWQQRKQALTLNGQAFIDGEYSDAADGAQFDCLNPADGETLISVTACGEADVERAVTAARRAFTAGTWSELAPAQRKRTLQKFARLISEHREELALLETIDMGKPISDSLRIDLPSAINCINWNAEAIDKVYGEVAPTDNSSLGLVVRVPLGVVGAIVPWNFPLMMACWKIAPALAAGNSVILKPSEKSPLSAIRIAGLAKEAGIPDGVLQVLPGFGHTTGRALALHMDVDCIAFTGSTVVGKQLIQYAGQSNMKQTWLECGGKSPNIVCADADNLDRVAREAASAIFYNQGEVCIAGSRLLVENSIKEDFVDRVMACARRMQPGNPLDPATRMGAIVDRTQFERVQAYIDQARQQGARLRMGGEAVNRESGGCYLPPTLFDGVDADMTIVREEIFGPVLSVIGFDSLDEAISIANDSDYGLAAAIWTSNLNRALKASKKLQSGQVYVNNYAGGDMTMPFGGVKQSGNGRDKSIHSLKEYSTTRSIWIAIGDA